MKIFISLLLFSILFAHENIYSKSYNSLNSNLDEISQIKKQMNKKYDELIKLGNYDQANIMLNMRSKLDDNWGQLFGLLEVLSITNDILLFNAYHECDMSVNQMAIQFHKISTKKPKPTISSRRLLDMAIKKLNIMNKAVTGMVKIDIKFFNRVAKSKDEKTHTHLNKFAVDINNILKR